MSRLLTLARRPLGRLFSKPVARTATMARPTPSVAVQWLSHGAKLGQHLETLEDLAHEPSRQAAAERRAKKKAKKAAKKEKETGAAVVLEGDHDEDKDDNEDDAQDDNVLPDPEEVKLRMLSIVESFEESLKALRGAEPTPELFESVEVEAYGAATPLKAVAQVVIVGPTRATATCFDPSLVKDVSTAIRNQLSLNPSVEDGGVVVIPLPRVSMETRQKTANELCKRAEVYRQRIRRQRRSAMDVVKKKGLTGKLEGVSKDDAFRVQTELEAATEEAITRLNVAADKKNADIMAV